MMPYVNSSAIDRVEYDPASRVLSIWFSSSRRYDYQNVPSGIYHSLIHASSVGTFYHRHVRDRYPYV